MEKIRARSEYLNQRKPLIGLVNLVHTEQQAPIYASVFNACLGNLTPDLVRTQRYSKSLTPLLDTYDDITKRNEWYNKYLTEVNRYKKPNGLFSSLCTSGIFEHERTRCRAK